MARCVCILLAVPVLALTVQAAAAEEGSLRVLKPKFIETGHVPPDPAQPAPRTTLRNPHWNTTTAPGRGASNSSKSVPGARTVTLVSDVFTIGGRRAMIFSKSASVVSASTTRRTKSVRSNAGSAGLSADLSSSSNRLSPEGIAPDHPYLVELGQTPGDVVVERAARDEGLDGVAAATYLALDQTRKRVQITLVSEGIREDEAAQIGLGWAPGLDEALSAALARHGALARIGVVTHGADIMGQIKEGE